MIDIHSHFIPGVDDGCDITATALAMLREAQAMGITDIICTPHYRDPFLFPFETVKQKFEEFQQAVKDDGIDINLFLGREIYCPPNIKSLIKTDNFFMNDTKYVLLEFSTTNNENIAELVYELKIAGYLPIIAHIERYTNVDIYDVRDIVSAGGLIQVNADSIVGDNKKFYKKKIKELFKNGLVHFVASDMHKERVNLMGKAYLYVSKKFGKECAEDVFVNNAKKIIEG